MAFGTGIIEVKCAQYDAIIKGTTNCASIYDKEIYNLGLIALELRGIQDEYDYFGREIDDAACEIIEQIEEYEEKKRQVVALGNTIVANALVIEDIENRVADRINENWGNFCDEFGIEYDDPEEWSIGEGLSDLWDGVCAVYETFEAAFDFIIDTALLVVAVVAAVAAFGTLLATGGIFAGLVFAAACFSVYESTCNFAASSLAFGYALQGDEENSRIYIELRNGNVAKDVFVGVAESLGFDPKKAAIVYTVINVSACVINIADAGKNLYNGGKNVVNAIKETPDVFGDAGKGWKGIKAAGKNIFKSFQGDSPIDETANMFQFGLTNLGVYKDRASILKEVTYLDDIKTPLAVADNVRGFIEADNDYKIMKENFTVIGNLAGIGNISVLEGLGEMGSKIFETSNAVDNEGINYKYGFAN